MSYRVDREKQTKKLSNIAILFGVSSGLKTDGQTDELTDSVHTMHNAAC